MYPERFKPRDVKRYTGFIGDVKRSADFVAIVSRYTSLRRSGRQLKGLCPFHSESHPSFCVDPVKKIYYCHGCQAGGDIFKFIMRAAHCDFFEALRISSETPESQPYVFPESFAEVCARIVQSLPAPCTEFRCQRCGSHMVFRCYRNNRFGGTYTCECGTIFGGIELRRSLLAIRGSSCQWCSSSSRRIEMHHVRKDVNQFDPAFIVLLCWNCHNNVKKIYALRLALRVDASEKQSFSRSGVHESGGAANPNSPHLEG